MYLPDDFAEHDPARLLPLIEQFPLADIVVMAGLQLDAFSVPMLLEQEAVDAPIRLLAHIARNNPLAQIAIQQPEVLLLFHLDSFYVSPNWYPSKQVHHQAVPTWNYGIIQVRGRLKRIDDEKKMRGLLAKLTRKNEQSQPKPWKMSDAPKGYLMQQLQKIVLIEIEVSQMLGKFKYSQNRSSSDRQGVMDGLDATGRSDLAEWVKQIAPLPESK